MSHTPSPPIPLTGRNGKITPTCKYPIPLRKHTLSHKQEILPARASPYNI